MSGYFIGVSFKVQGDPSYWFAGTTGGPDTFYISMVEDRTDAVNFVFKEDADARLKLLFEDLVSGRVGWPDLCVSVGGIWEVVKDPNESVDCSNLDGN